MSATDLPEISASGLPTAFIINPASGPVSQRLGRTERVEDFVRLHRLQATIEVSRRSGHAAQLARAAVARGAKLVVSVGGDGTMNEVARGVVGTSAVYGMIPTGSGNGLARDLGLPLPFRDSMETLLEGAVREIDTGEVNGLPFFNAMGLGFDAEIGRRFNLTQRRGFLSYLRIGVGTFLEYRKERIVVTPSGGEPRNIDAFLAAVANSTQYGNNARIAPRSRLDDGLLDFVAITSSNPIAGMAVVARLFSGSIDRSRWVQNLQASGFLIQRVAPGPVHTDGEVHHGEADLEVVVRPRSLRVLVPRETED